MKNKFSVETAKLRLECWKAIEGWGEMTTIEKNKKGKYEKKYENFGWVKRMAEADKLFNWCVGNGRPIG